MYVPLPCALSFFRTRFAFHCCFYPSPFKTFPVQTLPRPQRKTRWKAVRRNLTAKTTGATVSMAVALRLRQQRGGEGQREKVGEAKQLGSVPLLETTATWTRMALMAERGTATGCGGATVVLPRIYSSDSVSHASSRAFTSITEPLDPVATALGAAHSRSDVGIVSN